VKYFHFRTWFGIGYVCILAMGCKQKPEENSNEQAAAASNKVNPCIENAFKALSIDMNAKIDVELMTDILTNEMYLIDFPPVKKIFDTEIKGKSVSFRPLLEKIKNGIDKRNPAITEFLCAAQQQNLFPALDPEAHQWIKRTLHHTYMLSRVTALMTSSVDFMGKIIAHVRSKKPQFGIRPGIAESAQDINKIAGDWFMPAKAVTMDAGIDVIMNYRKGLPNAPTGKDLKNDPTGLILNISEAVATDAFRGKHSNALSGIALIVNPSWKFKITPDTHFSQYEMEQEWSSLYETWNLAFVTANVNNLHIIYPKLLIPEVLDSTPEDYLMVRAEALWLTIHYHIFAMARKQVTQTINGKTTVVSAKPLNLVLPNRDKIAKVWGDINLKYAKAYVKKKNNKDLNDLSDVITIPASATVDNVLNDLKKKTEAFMNQRN
jgi:hypothetical protein